jgi:hypothetical protein
MLKIGSLGSQVKLLQDFLQITVDGHFGPTTEKWVKIWQKNNGLKADGIVGPKTWALMTLASSDISETNNIMKSPITDKFLDSDEYFKGPTSKDYLFLHHTAGWDNPFNTISQWNTDNRGKIGTEFVIGGGNIKGVSKEDGVIAKAMQTGGYAWHLGPNGSQYMHTHSVGIELCNFGYLVNNKTYVGGSVIEAQMVTLSKEFKGFKTWHRYSDKQLKALSDLIKFVANRDSINILDGLPSFIREKGLEGFEFNPDAYYGKVKGLLSHTNTNKGKFDVFPQQELIDMLLSL